MSFSAPLSVATRRLVVLLVAVLAALTSMASTARAIEAPTAFTAEPRSQAVVLRWALPPGIVHADLIRFEVRYRAASGAAWTGSKQPAANTRATEISKLVNGTEYAFGIRAVTGKGTTDWSTDLLATPTSDGVSPTPTPTPTVGPPTPTPTPGEPTPTPTPGEPTPTPTLGPLLPAPTPFTAAAKNVAVVLSWGLPAGYVHADLIRFEVRYRAASGAAWTGSKQPAANTRATEISKLLNGTEYAFGIRAVTSKGTTDWSTDVLATPTAGGVATSTPTPGTPTPTPTPGEPTPTPSPTPTPGPVGPPAGVTVTPGAASATLRWGLPTGVAQTALSSFELRWAVAGTEAYITKAVLPNVRANVANALKNGTTYAFSVRAKLKTGELTPWAADVTATPIGAPAAPTSVSPALTGNGSQIAIRWTAPAADAAAPLTSWDVTYRAGTSSTFTTLATGLPAGSTELIADLPAGVKYTFRVRGIGPGGSGASAEGILVSPNFSLPVIRIDTQNAAPILDKENYVPGQYSVTDPATGTSLSSGAVETRGRGNSTWLMTKKPYRLKLGKAAALLGLPSNKHWALLANAIDPTYLRNSVAFKLGSQASFPWTPRSKPVELVLNGRYVGLYQLIEHVRLDPARINIDALKAADVAGEALTGGYHIERDARWAPGVEAGFQSARGEPFTLKDPEAPAPEQLAYIKNYVDQTEAALFGSKFKDPALGYAGYVDVQSVVDWYVVHEYVRTNDAWFSSGHMYKPRNGKLFFGPLWDFDYSLGTPSPNLQQPPTGFWVKNRSSWLLKLFTDPAFVSQVQARWQQLRPAVAGLPAYLDEQAALVKTAAGFDEQVWGRSAAFSNEVAKVRSFLTTRATWLDGQWPAPANQ